MESGDTPLMILWQPYLDFKLLTFKLLKGLVADLYFMLYLNFKKTFEGACGRLETKSASKGNLEVPVVKETLSTGLFWQPFLL